MNPEAQAKLEAIFAKSDLEITESDRAFVRARSSYLNEEQLARFDEMEDMEEVIDDNPFALNKAKLDEMSRPQLDEVAENLGLNPEDYSNKDKIKDAILNFGLPSDEEGEVVQEPVVLRNQAGEVIDGDTEVPGESPKQEQE